MRRRRGLVNDDQPGGLDPRATGAASESSAVQNGTRRQVVAVQAHHVLSERQTEHLVLKQHRLLNRQRREFHGVVLKIQIEPIAGVVQPAHLPEQAAAHPPTIQHPRQDQMLHQASGELGASAQISETAEGVMVTRVQQPLDRRFGEALDVVEAHADGVTFDRAARSTSMNVRWQHADTASPGIIGDYRRLPEAHRLVVENRAVKGLRVIGFQPGAAVDQRRKSGGVRLRERVAAEGAQRVEDLLGGRFGNALLGRPRDERLVQTFDGGVCPLLTQRSPQQLALPRCEARQVAGDF